MPSCCLLLLGVHVELSYRALDMLQLGRRRQRFVGEEAGAARMSTVPAQHSWSGCVDVVHISFRLVLAWLGWFPVSPVQASASVALQRWDAPCSVQIPWSKGRPLLTLFLDSRGVWGHPMRFLRGCRLRLFSRESFLTHTPVALLVEIDIKIAGCSRMGLATVQCNAPVKCYMGSIACDDALS